MTVSIASILTPQADWQTAYPIVGERVRAILAQAPQRTYSTTELVHQLHPEYKAGDKEQTRVRQHLMRAMRAIAKYDLAACVTRGPLQPVGFYKRPGRPMIWKYAKPQERLANPYDLDPNYSVADDVSDL